MMDFEDRGIDNDSFSGTGTDLDFLSHKVIIYSYSNTC